MKMKVKVKLKREGLRLLDRRRCTYFTM